MMLKRVLLTGASGTIGKEVLNLLWDKRGNYEISVLLRKSKKNERIIKPFRDDITIIWGNILNYDEVQKAVEGKEIIFHIAALLPDIALINPDLVYTTNIEGTQNIIKAMRTQTNNPKIIYPSSVAVYGERRANPIIRISDPIQNEENDVYTETKIEAENIIRNSGLDYIIFRVSYVVSTDMIKFRPIMFHMPLDTPVEMIHAKDVATAMVNAIARNDLWNNTYNLGGGQSCQIMLRDNLNDMFEIMGFGRNFLPDSAFTKSSFHCGFYDLSETKNLDKLIKFQNHNLKDFYDELKQWIGIKRFLIPLVRPILRKFILRKSEFYKKANIKDKI